MSVALEIRDEKTNGDLISESVLQFPADRVSVRQLIETRVRTEVEKYNASSRVRFLGLIQPNDSENVLNGFKVKKNKAVNGEKQVLAAINAFEGNGFFLLVNDKQLCDLEEVFIITPNTSVVFLKLIPLVGG